MRERHEFDKTDADLVSSSLGRLDRRHVLRGLYADGDDRRIFAQQLESG